MWHIDDFDLDSSMSVGGVTGSNKVQGHDGYYYQLKPSIFNASWTRRFKTNTTDRENFGEVIAAHVGRAITGSDIEGAFEVVPKVDLVLGKEAKKRPSYRRASNASLDSIDSISNSASSSSIKSDNGSDNQLMVLISVASRYLNGFQQTADAYAKSPAGGGVKTRKRHVKFSFNTTEPRDDIWAIGGKEYDQLRKDLARDIALAALAGDHDVNPGNVLIAKGKNGELRAARIDFGHAFNDLLTYRYKVVGGHSYNQNRILDFINREKVNAPFGGDDSKLWRDYEGVVPSKELADALKQTAIAQSESIDRGIASAKSEFKDLVDNISKDPVTSELTLNHIKKTLCSINQNSGSPDIDENLGIEQVLDKTLENLSAFYKKGQEQMFEVAELISVQHEIDKAIKSSKAEEVIIPQSVRERYDRLTEVDNISRGQGRGLRWAKCDADNPGFKGTLDEYIMYREHELNMAGANSVSQKALYTIKYKVNSTAAKLRQFFDKSSQPSGDSHAHLDSRSQVSQRKRSNAISK